MGGWIVLGITITLGSMYYLFNDYTKDPWGGINTAYRNLPAIIIVPTLMVFVPFLLGFLGGFGYLPF